MAGSININALGILKLMELIAAEVEGFTPNYTVAHKVADKVLSVAGVAEQVAPVVAAVAPGTAAYIGASPLPPLPQSR